MTTPSFAIVAATIAICSGVTSRRSWPNANRPGSTSESSCRVEDLGPLVEAARRPLVRRRLEGRRRVEAEALRVFDQLLRSELLADVAEDRVDRVLQRRAQVEPAEGGRRVVVVDPFAVDLAVARVDEARGRLEAAGVDRGRGGHDLERRARRVEAGRGAVEQRVGTLAVGARAGGPVEVALDVVGVVGGRGGHHEHLAGVGLERDHRAATAAERLERHLLRARDRASAAGRSLRSSRP